MNNQLTQKTDENNVSLSLEEFIKIIDACDEIVTEKMSRSSNACVDFAEQVITKQDKKIISIFDQNYDAFNNLYTYSNKLTAHCNPFEPYKNKLISQKWHLLFYNQFLFQLLYYVLFVQSLHLSIQSWLLVERKSCCYQ